MGRSRSRLERIEQILPDSFGQTAGQVVATDGANKYSLQTGLPPGGTASGDLSGSYPGPTVAKINGVALGSTTATSGNALVANGTQWVSSPISGDITLASGGAVVVTKINGATLGSTTATAGNVLIGSGAAWVTRAISGDITLSSAGAVVVTKINGATLGTTTATAGNILVGSSTAWVSVTPTGAFSLTSAGVSSLNANSVSNGVMNSMPARSVKCNPGTTGAVPQDINTSSASNFVFAEDGTGNLGWQLVGTANLASGAVTNAKLGSGSVALTNLGLGGTSAQYVRGNNTLTTASTAAAFMRGDGVPSNTLSGARWVGIANSEMFSFQAQFSGAGGATFFGASSASATPDAVISSSGGSEAFRVGAGDAAGIGHCRAQKSYGRANRFSIGTVGATGTVDWNANGDSQFLTLTSGTACTLSFTAPPFNSGAPMKLWLTAGAVAALTTLPATCKGTTSLTVTAGKTSLLYVEWDGTNYWVSVPVANA